MSEKWVVMSPDTVTSDLGSKNTCLVNLELSTTFLLPHMLKDGISGLMQFQAHSVGNRGIYKKTKCTGNADKCHGHFFCAVSMPCCIEVWGQKRKEFTKKSN